MCTTENKVKTLRQVVKETIDAVYEYLIPHQDGITMMAKDYGYRGNRVISKLVNRGIITKESVGGKAYRYKWVAAMAPTNVLYGSVADEIQAEDREYQANFRKRHARKKVKTEQAQVAKPDKTYPLSVVAELLESTPVSEGKEPKDVLGEIKEMWERMKELGVTIENNQLVFTEIKKTVLS